MVLENDICVVEIDVDETYTLDSADNRYYDEVLNPSNYTRNDFTRTLAICIDTFSKHISIALIGSSLIGDFDCAVLDNNILTVLLDQEIVQINVTDASIVRHIKLDGSGCNFGIYKVEKGYIVYGETEITMLGFDFEKKRAFSGKDIFVSISGKLPFEIKKNSICLYDFENNYYEIDYEGNQIQ